MPTALDVRTHSVPVASVDASGTPTIYVFKAPADNKIRIHKIYLTSKTAIAAAAANIHTSLIKRYRAGSATSIATQTTDSDVAASAAIVANVPWNIPLLSAALSELNAGDVLEWCPTEGGEATSGDLTACMMTIEYSTGYGGGI